MNSTIFIRPCASRLGRIRTLEGRCGTIIGRGHARLLAGCRELASAMPHSGHVVVRLCFFGGYAQGVPTISPAELAQQMVKVQQLMQQVRIRSRNTRRSPATAASARS